MGEDTIVSKYSSQLAELRINSKPLINLLTMMAEDYIRQAPLIVQVIEKHLTTVRTETKLPVLYLIDSIIKNVRKDYVELFTQNIVSTFCGVFEKADEKTRGLLFKLRGTWKDYFPPKKLYAIDVRCKQIDPNWPITAPAPATGNIHVNPRFLNRGKQAILLTPQEILASSTALTSTSSVSVPSLDSNVSDVQMRAQLLAKQKELLELQTKKVELELLQTELQMKAKEQQKELSANQLDITQKQELLLRGMAETAKNRTEQITQQLSHLHRPSPSTSSSTSAKASPLLKSYDSPSERESHHSHGSSSKHTKSNSDASCSSVDGSPSKKSKSSHRDSRKERSKSEKSSKDKHESKESRHSRRDKSSRHEKEKDKGRASHDRVRESSSASKSSSGGGEWKDYNEAKKISLSPPKKIVKKEPISPEEEESEPTLDIKPKRTPSPIPVSKNSISAAAAKNISDRDSDSNIKSPISASQSSEKSQRASGSVSPLKRRLPKQEKEHSKDGDGKVDKAGKDSNKVPSDPRLRRKMEREKSKQLEEKSNNSRESSKTGGEWKDYSERTKAVLRRSYRKTSGIEVKEEPNSGKPEDPSGGSDVDLRFEAMNRDLDLRGDVEPEPPQKKAKSGKDSAFDERRARSPYYRVKPFMKEAHRRRKHSSSLFGHQDVDLRAASSCWTQVKVKSDGISDRASSTDGLGLDEDERMAEVTHVLRSPGPSNVNVSAPNSVPPPSGRVLRSPGPTSPNVAVDPLGRPLIYNRLPSDPEERKRSLDSRSSSIDPIDQFRARYVDRALHENGRLSEEDIKLIFIKAKEELDQGFLKNEQYVTLMREVAQVGSKIIETTALREAQQMQMKDGSWHVPKPNNIPNPWVTENTENNIWAAAVNIGPGPGPAHPPPGPMRGVSDFPIRFPGANPPHGSWDTTPWMTPNMLPAPAGPNPFEEAIARPMMPQDLLPKANLKDLRMAEIDVGRTIPIDKVVREVRFYRDMSIIFMGMMNDDPRELSFQQDDMPRTILINGKPLELFIGESKTFDLNRVKHTLRIGAPGRELCLDDRRYELFFGGPSKKIYLDQRPHQFQLLPPSPQVTVGQVSRHDLCAGRVILTINAVNNVPVYLDEKVQKVDILGESLVLRFCDGFQTVTLNGRPFPTNFGARLPFSITTPNNNKHFLRFAAIPPETERNMQKFISMNYGDGKLAQSKALLNHSGAYLVLRRWSGDCKRALHSHSDNVDLDLELLGGRGGRGGGMMRGAPQLRGRGRGGRHPMDLDIRHNPWESEAPFEPTDGAVAANASNANPLDLLNTFFHHTSTPDHLSKNRSILDHSYESDMPGVEEHNNKEGESETPNNNSDAATPGSMNVGDLVANLIKFGLLPAAAPAKSPEEEEEKPNDEKGAVPQEEEKPVEKEPEKEKQEVKAIPPLPFVDVAFKDSLKERRDIVIAQISTGVQCSQCGLRFPPDQTLRYSQHLDWHFRQNRREKANARKALSRKWYYDLSDWIQFEEIEDLEERAASLFESQDAENENDAKSPTGMLNPDDYTVLASAHEGAVCPQCGETFESFFDEEREEWRLKNAKFDEEEGEEKLYHPICHQDYLRSLVEESIVEEDEPMEEASPPMDPTISSETENKENLPNKSSSPPSPVQDEEDDEVLIIKEGKKEIVVMEIDIVDDELEKSENVNVTKENENTSSLSTSEKKTETPTIVIEEENINNVEKDGENSCTGNDSSLDTASLAVADKVMVQSPIVIDEDSTFLPGLSDEAQVGVFGIALSSGSQPIRVEPVEEEKRIIYEPMKFDFPLVKVEPVDEDDGESEVAKDEFLELPKNPVPASDSEPMNIDLTEEDSMDAVESGGARLVMQIRTSIDGNLQHEDAAALPFIPASKIRINLFGVDSSPVSSPKEKVDSPQPAKEKSSGGDGESPDEVLKDGGGDGASANNINSNSEINKDLASDEPFLTEEMKRLKPRLVGRTLTNYPVKKKGKEESGLCVIC